MQRAVIVAAAAGTPDGLAVDRHHLALDLTRQGLCQRESSLERVQIDQHEPAGTYRAREYRSGRAKKVVSQACLLRP